MNIGYGLKGPSNRESLHPHNPQNQMQNSSLAHIFGRDPQSNALTLFESSDSAGRRQSSALTLPSLEASMDTRYWDGGSEGASFMQAGQDISQILKKACDQLEISQMQSAQQISSMMSEDVPPSSSHDGTGLISVPKRPDMDLTLQDHLAAALAALKEQQAENKALAETVVALSSQKEASERELLNAMDLVATHLASSKHRGKLAHAMQSLQDESISHQAACMLGLLSQHLERDSISAEKKPSGSSTATSPYRSIPPSEDDTFQMLSPSQTPDGKEQVQRLMEQVRSAKAALRFRDKEVEDLTSEVRQRQSHILTLKDELSRQYVTNIELTAALELGDSKMEHRRTVQMQNNSLNNLNGDRSALRTRKEVETARSKSSTGRSAKTVLLEDSFDDLTDSDEDGSQGAHRKMHDQSGLRISGNGRADGGYFGDSSAKREQLRSREHGTMQDLDGWYTSASGLSRSQSTVSEPRMGGGAGGSRRYQNHGRPPKPAQGRH